VYQLHPENVSTGTASTVFSGCSFKIAAKSFKILRAQYKSTTDKVKYREKFETKKEQRRAYILDKGEATLIRICPYP